ncbi:MAG: hypothetical protein TREMPRED_002296 [Tremellales sp. Tagirdzhanova-0007]|nr:MAG: hypothetical protein TREMPRED_002296 [Tremellales sp. Tagirdzhanova-0007]
MTEPDETEYEFVQNFDQSPSPIDWEPHHWSPWPLPEDYDFLQKSWFRPEQLPMSFVGVKLIDVENSKIIPGRTVKIRSGLIVDITDSQESDLHEEDWTCIDARGLYMCPGLIDCHVHITPPLKDAYTSYRVAFDLKRMLGNGFTTVRDVGGATRHHRDATAEWLIPGPRLLIGGPVLSQTGGHGKSFNAVVRTDHNDPDGPISSKSISESGMGPVGLLVDGVDACLKAARKLMSAGADHLKICSSGGVLSPLDKLDSIQFTVPEIKAICDTARNMGATLVTSHCFTSQGARNAIEGGVGGIEHGSLLDEPTLKLMAEKGIHLTPTLLIAEMIVNGPLGAKESKLAVEKAKLVNEKGYGMVQNAHRLGVNIAFGTDAFVPVQLSEFELRAKILPSHIVLQQATCNGAKVLGMEGKVGCLKKGAFADLLLLDANPLEDIKILNRPKTHLKAVVKDGRYTPLTERLDYFAATLTISLTLLYAALRILSLQTPVGNHRLALPMSAVVSCIVLAHFTYLLSFPTGSFPYGYHTTFNLILGITHNLLWILWSTSFYFALPSTTICGLTIAWPYPYPPNDPLTSPRPKDSATPISLVVLTTAAMSLELLDFAPLFRMMDAHSLWHASTIPLAIAWWTFLCSDAVELEGALLASRGVTNVALDEKMQLSGGGGGGGDGSGGPVQQQQMPSTPNFAQLAAGSGIGLRNKSPGRSPKIGVGNSGDKGERAD